MAYPPDNNPLLAAFQRLRKGLLRMATGLTGCADDAEDALQDAFVKMWTKRTDIHTADEAAAMLTVAVKHLSIDRIRRRQTAPLVELTECYRNYCEPADESKEDTQIKYNEVMQLIRTRLTPLQQQIIHLRDYREKSYDDIAYELNMQPTAVRMQLSRARKTIRDIYRELHAND